MYPYLIMLSLVAVLALVGAGRSRLILLSVATLFWLFVGFRWKVGMDWNNYLFIYQGAAHQPLGEYLFQREPAYQLLMWLATWSVSGYLFINATAAAIFCFGLFQWARKLPEPYLAVVFAFPLLIVAFGMAAVRQSIALGILFFLFAAWDQKTVLGRILWVFIASLFHFSALFVLVFVALGARVTPTARLAALLGVIVLMAAVISLDPGSINSYSELYVARGAKRLEAPGALVQTGVIASAALLYFLVRERWHRKIGHSPLMDNLAIAALISVPASLVSSVGAYRFALYLSPMAMYAVAGIPTLIERPEARLFYRLLLCFAAFALLVGWFTFSNNGYAWLPYQNWLVDGQEGGMVMTSR